MLNLKVEHTQPPIYGYPLDTRKEPATVRVSIEISSSERTHVGAIRAAWQVTRQLPIAGRSIQECWTWGEVTPVETILTEVRSTNSLVDRGSNVQADFTLFLPVTLPPTSKTDFERVFHTLYVSVFAPAPDFPSLPLEPTRSGSVANERGTARGKGWGALVLGRRALALEVKAVEVKAESKSNNPLADAFGPSIASFESQVKYLTPLHVRGVSPLFDVTKFATAEGLGVVRLTAVTNVMTLGSAFFICCTVNGIAPTSTVFNAQLRLHQQSSSADGTETHHDDYILHHWFEPPDESGTPRPLWPGPSHSVPRSAVFPPRASSDTLHLSALPRLPSPSCGAKVSTVPHGLLSRTKHAVVVELEFATETSSDGAHARRKIQMQFDVTLGDCTMTYSSVQTPRYTVVDPQQAIDLKACLEPYPMGAEPPGCLLERTSWIVRDGKSLERRRIGYQAPRTRTHQLETAAICMCFFENVHGNAPPGVSWTDIIEAYTSPLDDASLENVVKRDDAECLSRSPRKSIPGFIHAYFSQCVCQENPSATGRASGPKMSAQLADSMSEAEGRRE